MMIPVDINSDDYKYRKTLNEDVQLKPISPTSNHWDIQMENGDYVNLTGKDSLHNAICIAIMTRLNELQDIQLYDGFGCRVHELVKANKSDMVKYQIEVFVNNVLSRMRRINQVNSITVTDSNSAEYQIHFNVTSVYNEIVEGSVTI